MANILLTCFAPSITSCNDRLAGELISSVASDLHLLQKSLEESPPTLRWCSEAMMVVKKAHSHFLVYFERNEDCSSLEDSTMVDDYMGVSLDLLDLCNLLKSALSGLDRRRMMVDFMVKTVKDASFMTTMASKIELEKNESEKSNNFFKFRKWREMYTGNTGTVSKVKMKSRTKMHILQPISSTISIISLFVFYSVLHPNPIEIHEKFHSMVQNRYSFSVSVGKPGITFSTGKPVLHEKEMIEDALAAFTAELKAVKAGEDEGKLTERLDELKNRSADLKQRIDLLESVINELFDDVIKGRKKVIDLITTNNHSLYNC